MFRNSAERALSSMARDHQTGALLFVDLDRFKQVNDTQGHAAGDTLLRVVAQRLDECVRAQDCIGRLSGDEFVLLLSNCTTEQAVQTAQRVLGSIAMPVDIQGQINLPSASVGISIYPYDGTDIDTWCAMLTRRCTRPKRPSPQPAAFQPGDEPARPGTRRHGAGPCTTHWSVAS